MGKQNFSLEEVLNLFGAKAKSNVKRAIESSEDDMSNDDIMGIIKKEIQASEANTKESNAKRIDEAVNTKIKTLVSELADKYEVEADSIETVLEAVQTKALGASGSTDVTEEMVKQSPAYRALESQYKKELKAKETELKTLETSIISKYEQKELNKQAIAEIQGAVMKLNPRFNNDKQKELQLGAFLRTYEGKDFMRDEDGAYYVRREDGTADYNVNIVEDAKTLASDYFFIQTEETSQRVPNMEKPRSNGSITLASKLGGKIPEDFASQVAMVEELMARGDKELAKELQDYSITNN